MAKRTARARKVTPPAHKTAAPGGAPPGRQAASGSGPARRSAPTRKNARTAPRRRGMSANTKITLGLVGVVLAILAYVFVVNRDDEDKSATVDTANPLLVREDSHRLSTAADGKVTLVEFLDFECEACGAAYPGVERLRKEYQGKITYVVRYFPLQNHFNARNAAHAAEAAAKQGKFEAMYTKLFDTQKDWGEARQSHADRFAGYAAELGLDMDRYRADVAAAATAERVQRDVDDGKELGVSATPTFFLNGEKLTTRPTYTNLKTAIDAALAK